jgi:hypothetical protein
MTWWKTSCSTDHGRLIIAGEKRGAAQLQVIDADAHVLTCRLSGCSIETALKDLATVSGVSPA